MNQVITACAFIHDNNKLFVAKRSDDSSFLPGLYELPGGHIEQDENIVEGLKREIKEEFCKNVSVGDPFFVFTYFSTKKAVQNIEIIYFAKFTDTKTPIIVTSEHSTYTWIPKQEISQIFHNNEKEKDAALKGFRLLDEGLINFG